jgi:hypothetical protein
MMVEVEFFRDLVLEDVLVATGIPGEDFCLFLENKLFVWMARRIRSF